MCDDRYKKTELLAM